MSRKEEKHKHKIESSFNFRNFFKDEEEMPEVEDNSFVGMSRKLREQKEAEAKETKEISEEVTDYFVGRVMDVLYLTGTALGNRIHDMILGSSSDNEDSN